MKFIDDLSISERVLVNSFLIAGIQFLTTMAVNLQYPPTPATIYGAAITALVTLSIQVKTMTSDNEQKPPKPILTLV